MSVTSTSLSTPLSSSDSSMARARVAPATRHIDWQVPGVALIAALAGGVSTYLAQRSDLILLYNDSMSHLDVARRVVDSRTPGLVQLGTVWLPVPHILLLPMVWNHFLWRTGLAGSVVGLGCLVVTAVCLFQSIRLITRHGVVAWLGLVVLLTNPNVLYLQSTALTEPVLLASMTASAYFLLKWSKRGSHVDLALAGCCAMLAVGSRYDGWFFAVECAGLIMLTTWLRSRSFAEAQGVTLAYAILPIYAMALWVVYNWIIFGDPLYFQRSEFSAAFQQQRFFLEGRLPTRGNLAISVQTYGWAVLENIGVLVTALGALGAVVYAVRTRFRRDSLIPYAFLSGLLFNVIALVLGQSVLMVPTMDPPGYFNIRYGIVVLPGFALFIAYFADALARWVRPLATAAIVATILGLQVALWLPGWPRSVITIADGLGGLSTKTNPVQTAHYLRDHYTGGGVLVDDTLVGLLFETGLDLQEFVATGNGEIWRSALSEPADYVEWVAFRPNEVGDRVTAALADEPALTDKFTEVFAAEGYVLYKRNQATPSPAVALATEE